LLVNAWLGSEFESISSLYNIISALSGCAKRFEELDEQNLDEFEEDFLIEYLPKFRATCENTSSLTNAFAITLLFGSILLKVNNLNYLTFLKHSVLFYMFFNCIY
jgi:hypothetical protein